MPELIAQGPRPEHRWRRRLLPGQSLFLGREAGRWSIFWDEHVSRQHAEIRVDKQQLYVERIPTAVNAIFVRGSEQESFELQPGEHFVIGGTTFTLVNEQLNVTLDSPSPVTEQTISYDLLQQIRFDGADRRIDVLSSLPESLAAAASDAEQAQALLTVLLTAIDASSFVALVELTEADEIVVSAVGSTRLGSRRSPA